MHVTVRVIRCSYPGQSTFFFFLDCLYVSQALQVLRPNFGLFLLSVAVSFDVGSINFYTIRYPVQMQIKFDIFTSALTLGRCD